MSTFTGPDRYQQEAEERASFYSNISRRLKDIQSRLQELVEEEEASQIADSDLVSLLSVEVDESMIDETEVIHTPSPALILQNDVEIAEVEKGDDESEIIASSWVLERARDCRILDVCQNACENFVFDVPPVHQPEVTRLCAEDQLEVSCKPTVCQNASEIGYEILLNKPPPLPPNAALNAQKPNTIMDFVGMCLSDHKPKDSRPAMVADGMDSAAISPLSIDFQIQKQVTHANVTAEFTNGKHVELLKEMDLSAIPVPDTFSSSKDMSNYCEMNSDMNSLHMSNLSKLKSYPRANTSSEISVVELLQSEAIDDEQFDFELSIQTDSDLTTKSTTECSNDGGSMYGILDEYVAVMEVQPEVTCKIIPFNFSSDLLSSKDNHVDVEKLVSEPVFLVLNDYDKPCIEGVRQNAYKKLVFYFPPAKPPDKLLGAVKISVSNIAGIHLVSWDTLRFTLYWGIALASIQKNKSLSRTSIKTCLMLHDLFVADDRVAPEIKPEVSYVVTMDSYFNESHMIPMKDAETFSLIRMVFLFYQATRHLSQLNRSRSSSMLELLQAFFNGIAKPDLHNHSEKHLDSYWWQFTSWVTINGNLKVSGVQLWSSLIWYVCISSKFKNSIIQHSFWMAYVCCELFYCWSWLFYELENFLKHILIDTETIDTGSILRLSLKKLHVSINFTTSYHDLNGIAVLYHRTVPGKALLSLQFVVETMIIKASDVDYSNEARFIPFESHIPASLDIELMRYTSVEVKALYVDSSISQIIPSLLCLDAKLMKAYGKHLDPDNKEHQLATNTMLLDSDTKPSEMVGLLIILSRENVSVEYLPCTIYYKIHTLSKWLGQSDEGCVLITKEMFDVFLIHHFEEGDKIDWVDVKYCTENFYALVNKGSFKICVTAFGRRDTSWDTLLCYTLLFLGGHISYNCSRGITLSNKVRIDDHLVHQIGETEEKMFQVVVPKSRTPHFHHFSMQAGLKTTIPGSASSPNSSSSFVAWERRRYSIFLFFSSPRPPDFKVFFLNLEDKVFRRRMECYATNNRVK